MIKILRFTIGVLPIILKQLIALIVTGSFIIGITIFINEITEYSVEHRSITNQLIKELEKSHNETKSYSTLFSISTKALQINQVDKLISTKNKDNLYNPGRYVGATLKIKNLTDKTCNLNPSFFEKLFGKYDKIEITKNTLVPSEETLVYIVFRNIHSIHIFESNSLNYKWVGLKQTADEKEYNGINTLLNHYDYILHGTSEYYKNCIGTESEHCKDKNSDSCRFYEDNVSKLEYFTNLQNKINTEMPLVIEQHFCK
ncbi:hypothetical protein [Candidatus Tisiphia endosymbiont of Xenochironomus xenolabis]|uniref:hypothetical protein n=1 Tax=unclassified Candidatus Tisiphia TaxID=2996318 RepID=UPI0035C9323E